MTKYTLPLLATGLLALNSAALADHHEGDAPAPPETADASKIDFATQIYPIFEAKCIKCHQQPYYSKPPVEGKRPRVKKPKSKMRMDGKKFIIAGGSIQSKEGEAAQNLTPGDASKSTIYTYTTLPAEDDLHMPTKGDDLTAEEQELLKNWIDQGADFGEWTGNESEEIAEYDPERD